MENTITQEELMKMKEAADKASESTIPFPIVKDGNVAVAGDPNKTELNKQEFEIDFRVLHLLIPRAFRPTHRR